jgi:hypothetical protein
VSWTKAAGFSPCKQIDLLICHLSRPSVPKQTYLSETLYILPAPRTASNFSPERRRGCQANRQFSNHIFYSHCAIKTLTQHEGLADLCCYHELSIFSFKFTLFDFYDNCEGLIEAVFITASTTSRMSIPDCASLT